MREFSEFLYQLGEWLSQNWIVLTALIVVLTVGLIWICREMLRWFLGFGGVLKEVKHLRQELSHLKKKMEAKEPPAVTPTPPMDPLAAFEADHAYRTPEL